MRAPRLRLPRFCATMQPRMTNHDPPEAPELDTAESADDADGPDAPEAQQSLAPLDFSTFIMSLGSSAMVNLGEIPPPGGSQPQVDLDAAKQMIDILGILEEKTRGNLDESEARLLQNLLYDLRVHYVDAQHNK